MRHVLRRLLARLGDLANWATGYVTVELDLGQPETIENWRQRYPYEVLCGRPGTDERVFLYGCDDVHRAWGVATVVRQAQKAAGRHTFVYHREADAEHDLTFEGLECGVLPDDHPLVREIELGQRVHAVWWLNPADQPAGEPTGAQPAQRRRRRQTTPGQIVDLNAWRDT